MQQAVHGRGVWETSREVRGAQAVDEAVAKQDQRCDYAEQKAGGARLLLDNGPRHTAAQWGERRGTDKSRHVCVYA